MTKLDGSNKYYWVPCSGCKDINPHNLPGHLGIVREGGTTDNFPEVSEWITWEVALGAYQHVVESSSNTHCPFCSAVWDTI